MKLTVETDVENDLLYLSLSERALEPACVKRTQQIDDNINLDFDAEGRLLGVEIIGASRVIGTTIDAVKVEFLAWGEDGARGRPLR